MKLYAWGANTYGQLCSGHTGDLEVPTEISLTKLITFGAGHIRQICGGGGHVLVLTENGLFGCGQNNRGQLGFGTQSENELTLKPVVGLPSRRILKVVCGWEHSFCLTDDGKLWGWGANNYYQLGCSPELKLINKPTEIKPDIEHKIIDVSAGLRHSAAVSDGALYTWGSGRKGQLGFIRESKSVEHITVPNLIYLPYKVKNVSCGSNHTIAVCENGRLYGWGCNRYGQLAENPEVIKQSSQSVEISKDHFKGENIAYFQSGWTHVNVITDTGKIFNWGRNDYKQLGRTGICWIPKPLDISKILQLSTGSEHNIAITDDHQLLCWGWNEHGICGTGATDHQVPVPTLTNQFQRFNVSLIGTGYGSSFAIVNQSHR